MENVLLELPLRFAVRGRQVERGQKAMQGRVRPERRGLAGPCTGAGRVVPRVCQCEVPAETGCGAFQKPVQLGGSESGRAGEAVTQSRVVTSRPTGGKPMRWGLGARGCARQWVGCQGIPKLRGAAAPAERKW